MNKQQCPRCSTILTHNKYNDTHVCLAADCLWPRPIPTARYRNLPTFTTQPSHYKLSPVQVRNIRRKYAEGMRHKELAKQYNVHRKTIGNVVALRSHNPDRLYQTYSHYLIDSDVQLLKNTGWVCKLNWDNDTPDWVSPSNGRTYSDQQAIKIQRDRFKEASRNSASVL